MNRTTCIQHAKRLALGLAALALAAAPSFAQTTIDLCATTGTATVTTGVDVPIWGYVLGSTCAPGVATLPNPVIRATAGETLTINLTNNLTETVSFFVPGVPGTATGGVAGVFTTEAGASGGTVSYTFTPDAGTYLYQSATSRIRTQVPMGLYGALVVDEPTGDAYPGVPYDQDQVLVYSTIDPALNANPATYGGARVSKNTMSVADQGFVYGWKPEYFLINGKAHPSTETVYAGAGNDVLLRFVNAGLDTVVPTLGGGLYMDVIAEDGNPLPVAFSQYGLELQPGKTFDALINLATVGTYPLYDRALNLTNGASASGGMLVYLDSTPAPIVNGDAYAGTEDTQIVAGAPGVLTNDTAADGVTPIAATYTASLVSNASNGSVALAADGSFTYTPNLNFYGVDSFS
jgi:FtsP/CotA-like multicopper oxidase with cupredoxin domain